jgi:hypothetical protein
MAVTEPKQVGTPTLRLLRSLEAGVPFRRALIESGCGETEGQAILDEWLAKTKDLEALQMASTEALSTALQVLSELAVGASSERDQISAASTLGALALRGLVAKKPTKDLAKKYIGESSLWDFSESD